MTAEMNRSCLKSRFVEKRMSGLKVVGQQTVGTRALYRLTGAKPWPNCAESSFVAGSGRYPIRYGKKRRLTAVGPVDVQVVDNCPDRNLAVSSGTRTFEKTASFIERARRWIAVSGFAGGTDNSEETADRRNR